MSEAADASYEPHWWQEKKAASLRRKARARRAAAALAQPGDAFLIVTEGTVTEPIYFNLLLFEFQLLTVRIRVQPGDASDPRHVIETAAREAKQQIAKAKKGILSNTEPPKFDHVWAVVDTDVAVRNGFWNEVRQLASARKVMLANSTPCFEYWLLLHLADTTRGDLVDGAAAKSAVKQVLGQDYSTNEQTARAALTAFVSQWESAVSRAARVRQYHLDAATPPPGNPSTEVDLLVRALNDSAPARSRRLGPASSEGSQPPD